MFSFMDNNKDMTVLWNRQCEVIIVNFKNVYNHVRIWFRKSSNRSKVKPDIIAQVNAVLQEKELIKEINRS